MNIVLMAGGGGTRLWPLSRKNNPKQFLALGDNKTLLELTYDRARAVTEPANIFVATIREYAPKIKKLLPDIPDSNIFYEPARKDTSAAFAAVAVQLVEQGRGEEPTIFLWSDHVFTNDVEFIGDVRKIPEILEQNPNSVVMVGHTPTYPETGFGYIEVGEALEGYKDVFRVVQFKEKPDKATAEKFLATGKFFWNMGTFSLRPNYLLDELRRYEPEFMKTVDEFAGAIHAQDEARADEVYKSLKPIAIEYTFIEKTPNIIVVTGDYGWNDVGNWAAIKEIFGTAGDHMPLGHHVQVDSENNYIYNATQRAVSLIGVSNTIVVVTEDAILVTDTKAAPKVKEVVAKLEADEQTDYL